MTTGILALLIGLVGFAFAGGSWYVPAGTLALAAVLAALTFVKRSPQSSGWTWANTLAVAGVVLAGVSVARVVM